MNSRFLFALVAGLSLTACGTLPKPLQGQFSNVNPHDSVNTSQIGTLVRWGGAIIQTKPSQNETCFELISRPLNASGRPDRNAADTSNGRFIACRAGFYDPAVFMAGREVTFIGRIQSYQDTQTGEYHYKIPKVAADVIYLWPEVREVEVIPAYPYGPWGLWGPRWGWGYPGWW